MHNGLERVGSRTLSVNAYRRCQLSRRASLWQNRQALPPPTYEQQTFRPCQNPCTAFQFTYKQRRRAGISCPAALRVSGMMVRVIGFRMMGTRSRHTAGGCRAAGRSGACAAARQQAQAQAQSKKQREHTFHRFSHPFKIKDPLWPSVPPRLTSTCCQNGHRPGHFPHRVPLRIGLKHPSEVSAYKNHF